MSATEVAALLFQSNPDQWDLRADFVPGRTVDWLAQRYRPQMRPGTLALFWEAMGSEWAEVRGLYGWGIVLDEPRQDDEDVPRTRLLYVERWSSPDESSSRDSLAPLPAQAVLGLPAWKEHQLNSYPTGTNFAVNGAQLSDLREIVASRFPQSRFPQACELAIEGADLRPFVDQLELPRGEETPGDEPRVEIASPDAAQTPDLPLRAKLHRDRWADENEDLLGYSLYAKAIQQFIVNQDTDPTLVIAILAPWGQGKTTLMRLVQREFARGAGAAGGGTSVPAPTMTEAVRATFAHLRAWLDKREAPKVTKLRHPTVWFNAWHFESSEQVWAGLAHSIVTQLVQQVPDELQRERFWLDLQARRLDFNAIRSDIHRAVFERFLPKALGWGIAFFAGLVSFGVTALTGLWREGPFFVVAPGLVTVGSAIMAVAGWIRTRQAVDAKPLEGKFERFVRQPDYESRRGFLTDVQEDVARVFDLLVEPEHPAVVFIDDLDRCSPSRVAEIMEALNHFVGGDLRAYFVIGMDAQVVAAAMEVAHEGLNRKLEGMSRRHGSMGWYYLEKFIQLQFVIPSMSADARRDYLQRQFQATSPIPAVDPGSGASAGEAVARTEKRLGSELLAADLVKTVRSDLEIVRRHDIREWSRLAGRILEKAAPQLDDSNPMIQVLVDTYAPALGANPRTIKRFANLLRFYVFTQWARALSGLEFASPPTLARWIVLMMRWPELVRWVQWDGDDDLVASAEPSEKAMQLERQICESDTYDAWANDLRADWKERHPRLVDEELWTFLHARTLTEPPLSKAVELGVW